MEKKKIWRTGQSAILNSQTITIQMGMKDSREIQEYRYLIRGGKEDIGDKHNFASFNAFQQCFSLSFFPHPAPPSMLAYTLMELGRKIKEEKKEPWRRKMK